MADENIYRVTLRKERSTWHYFTMNPQGGGFGSNYAGPKKYALARAIQNIPVGSPYQLITNGKDEGVFIKT